jgi:hypothetical protein
LRSISIRLGNIAQDAGRATGGELNHMDDQRRDAVEIVLRDAHNELVKLTTTMGQFQAFVAPRNIELLDAWCRHSGSDVAQCGIEVSRVENRLDFAYLAHGNYRCTARVAVAEELLLPVPRVAAFDQGSIDE